METRTEKEWRDLHEKCILAIIQGRFANYNFSDFSPKSIISTAIEGADCLVKELKKSEQSITGENE